MLDYPFVYGELYFFCPLITVNIHAVAYIPSYATEYGGNNLDELKIVFVVYISNAFSIIYEDHTYSLLIMTAFLKN